jgi:fumarate reductase flavoprotein subunit
LFLTGLLVFCFGLTGCPSESPGPEYNTGTATAKVPGYTGNLITVTITLTERVITSARVTGADSTDRGQIVINRAGAEMIQKNTVEIDTLTGSTVTSNAIREAGRAALAKIKRGEFDPQ